jgi:hypothetical protein
MGALLQQRPHFFIKLFKPRFNLPLPNYQQSQTVG